MYFLGVKDFSYDILYFLQLQFLLFVFEYSLCMVFVRRIHSVTIFANLFQMSRRKNLAHSFGYKFQTNALELVMLS